SHVVAGPRPLAGQAVSIPIDGRLVRDERGVVAHQDLGRRARAFGLAPGEASGDERAQECERKWYGEPDPPGAHAALLVPPGDSCQAARRGALSIYDPQPGSANAVGCDGDVGKTMRTLLLCLIA